MHYQPGSSTVPDRHAPSRGVVTPFNVIDEAFYGASGNCSEFGIEIEVRVPGKIDEHRLRGAIERAAMMHPMARARKAAGRPGDNRYEWEIVDGFDIDPLVVAGQINVVDLHRLRDDFQSMRVPIDRSPPFRALLVHQPDGDVFMVNHAHTAMDGIGAMRLMQSIARAYAGDPDPLPPVDALAVRSLAHLMANAFSSEWFYRMQALHQLQLEAWLAPPTRVPADQGDGRPGYGVLHAQIPSEMATSLEPDPSAGATLNDLLVAAMHTAVERWCRLKGSLAQRIAVLVALNLRHRVWVRDVVGNFSLSATVSTFPRDRLRAGVLLQRIVEQTRIIKRDKAAAALIDVFGGLARLPQPFKSTVAPFIQQYGGDRFVPTTSVSNLGHVDERISFGDAGTANEVWFSGSGRMPMTIALSVLSYCGALHLSLRYRCSQLSASAGQEILDMYVESLQGLR